MGNIENTVLSNGNYIVSSPNWSSAKGASTWGSGTTGITGTVSSTNSLIGTPNNYDVGTFGIIVLSNSNYVVVTPTWNNSTGAVTWRSGTIGTGDTISHLNSLIGNVDNSYVGFEVTALPNGNYVVNSVAWTGTSYISGAQSVSTSRTALTDYINNCNSVQGSSYNSGENSFNTYNATHSYLLANFPKENTVRLLLQPWPVLVLLPHRH